MENAPKDAEAIDGPILEEEPSAEKYLFDATILRGKESYDAFAANISDKTRESLPDYDSLHLKQKLLFSHLRPEASKFSEISLQRQVAAVDAHGLSIENMAFDFEPELRKEIHRAVLSEVVGDAKDSEEAAERLAGANATFRDYLKQRAEANVRTKIQREYLEANTSLREKIMSRYEKTTLLTLRRNFVESLRPDSNKESIVDITKKTANWEKNRKDRDSYLYEMCGKISKKGLAIEDGEVGIRVKNEVNAINNIFERNEMLFAKYATVDKLAKKYDTTAEDPRVTKALSRIMDDEIIIPKNDEIYDISESYLEAKRKCDATDYFSKYISKSEDFSYAKLSGILQEKEKAAFIEFNRLYTGLTREESENMFNHDFSLDLAQKKKAYVIEKAGFSEEEYNDITGGKVDGVGLRFGAGPMAIRLADGCIPAKRKQLPAEQRSNLAYAARALHYAVVSELYKNFDESQFEAPKEVQAALFQRPLKNDLNYLRSESYRPSGRQTVSSSLKGELSLDEAKAQVLSIMAPNNDEQSAEYTELIDKTIEEVRRRIDGGARYFDAMAHFGVEMCEDDKKEYQDSLLALKKERDQAIDNLPEDRVAAEYGEEMKKFSHRIFNDEIDEVFILPTGFVARHKDGDYQAISVDTASNEIARRLDEGWDTFWRSYLRSDEYNNLAYKECIIKTVNERIEADFAKNIEFADKETQALFERCSESGIGAPGTLDSRSGTFAEQLTEADCDNYEHCREKFGRYFDINTAVANGTYEPHESTLESSAKDYIYAGAAIGTEAIVKTPGKGSIILKRYSVLAEKLGQDVADSYIINNISSGVFTRNEKNLVPILKNILGDEINISVVTAMRLTGKKIMAAESRQKAAMRALFAANYNRYIRGEEIKDAKLAELIRRVDELEYGKDES